RMMCAAAYQGNVVCLDVRNGRMLWNAKVDAVSGPASDGRNVYVVTSRGEIKAFDYETGYLNWTNSDLLWRKPSAAVPVDDVVAVGDYDGVLHFLNPATGEIVGRSSVSGAVRVPAAPMPEGGALFQTETGRLAYIRVKGE
ncbi:MAG: PQQ-binding-like beta-propeller repeat protein, partial [Duodenibacillus sp.]|nr:PQQ-binding-like beta-propeller repeat protein [Duodenibacillus sp.]